MNSFMMGLFVFFTTLFSNALAIADSERRLNYSVESWESVSKDKFNQALVKAKNNNEQWVGNPILWGVHLLNLTELKNFSYHYVADSVEDNSGGNIIIVRDGFLDDSIRGDLHEISIKKIASNWEIQYVKKAFRCWRNSSLIYGTKICP